MQDTPLPVVVWGPRPNPWLEPVGFSLALGIMFLVGFLLGRLL